METRRTSSNLQASFTEGASARGGSKRGGYIERQLTTNQGFDFSIPQEFIQFPLDQNELQIDELMLIPKESDILRKFLAQELTTAINDPENCKNWMLVYGDADQLKRANDHSRALGDMTIVYTATVVAQHLRDANLPQGVRTYLVKNGDTVDEVLVWVFGVTKDDIERVKGIFGSLQPVPANIKVKEGEEASIAFEFSSTVSVVSGHDEDIGLELTDTQGFLNRNPGNIAWNFYNSVKSRADYKAKSVKSEEDRKRLENQRPNHRMYIWDLIETLSEKYGGGRISQDSFRMLLKLVAMETIYATSGNPDPFKEICASLGIDEKKLRSAQSVKNLTELFDLAFKKSPSQD